MTDQLSLLPMLDDADTRCAEPATNASAKSTSANASAGNTGSSTHAGSCRCAKTAKKDSRTR